MLEHDVIRWNRHHYALLSVVPANAGTHSHKLTSFPTGGGPSLLNYIRLWL